MLELLTEEDLERLVSKYGFQFREKEAAFSLLTAIRSRLAYDRFYKNLEKEEVLGMPLFHAQAAYIALCYLDYFACSQNLLDGNKRLALKVCVYFLEKNKFRLLPEKFSKERLHDLIVLLIDRNENSENKNTEKRERRLQKYYKTLQQGLDYQGKILSLISG